MRFQESAGGTQGCGDSLSRGKLPSAASPGARLLFHDSAWACRSPDLVPSRPYSRCVARPVFIDSNHGVVSVKAILRRQPHSLLFTDYTRITAREFESECRVLITEHCDLCHCQMVHQRKYFHSINKITGGSEALHVYLAVDQRRMAMVGPFRSVADLWRGAFPPSCYRCVKAVYMMTKF